MTERKNFLVALSEKNPTRLEQATALLWFYTYEQEFEERSVSDLSSDLQDDGFGSVNITRLDRELRRSRYTVRGSRPGTFKINAARFSELTKIYGPLISIRETTVSGSIFSQDFASQLPRTYLQKIVHQINGNYDYGFFDSCLVMIRRLTESLIIEVFIHNKKLNDIKNTNGDIFMLESLIKIISFHPQIHISRNLKKDLELIKELGDTAAHDRTYISKKEDVEDNRHKFRRAITELLSLSGIIN